MGDRESGAISMLGPKQQEMAEAFLAGSVMDLIVDKLMPNIGGDAFVDKLKGSWEDIVGWVKQDPSPTLGELMTRILEMVLVAAADAVVKLKEFLVTCNDLLFSWVLLFLETLNWINAPKDLLPDMIYEFISQEGSEPNLLGLMLALPIHTLKRLLTLPLGDLNKAFSDVEAQV